jgi:hypothetical protein
MKKLIVALVGLAVSAPGALALSPSSPLKISPRKVAQGNIVTVSGSVDHGCEIGHKGDAVTIFSRAFKGATRHRFAGIPSVKASLARSTTGSFRVRVTLSSNVKPGKYIVTGRCGGGNIGSARLRVTSGLPQGY